MNDMDSAEFLIKLNDSLLELETELNKSLVEEKYPNIFILGLPRSGTTLLTQLIFNCFDVSCTNNLMAKYWKTPLVGAHLSKILIGDFKPNCFDSFYGKDSNISSPHEFSYFWHDILKLDENNLFKRDTQSCSIDWVKLKNKFININNVFEKTVVYKPLELVGYFLNEFYSNFEKSFFIYIERNYKDVIFSLAKGRLDYYGDINKWFSSIPPNKEDIDSEPYFTQIPSQVFNLRDFYFKKLKSIPEDRYIKIRYEDLCRNPMIVLNKVAEKLKNIFNFELKIINKPPSSFLISKPKLNETIIIENLLKGISQFDF